MNVIETRETRLEAIANSALLKILSNGVLIVSPPLLLWGMSMILTKLDVLDKAVNESYINKATTELRMKAQEDVRANERLLKAEFEIEQLKRMK